MYPIEVTEAEFVFERTTGHASMSGTFKSNFRGTIPDFRLVYSPPYRRVDLAYVGIVA